MVLNKQEALQYIRDNNILFICLQFCDIFGELKNISIMPSQLEHAFDYGTEFNASAIKGFLNETESNLLLFPDPTTMSPLPQTQQGKAVRFFCDIRRPDGSAFEGDCRRILKETVKRAAARGLHVNIGPECEFYLCRVDNEGIPTPIPHDAGSYFAVAPFDKGENIRREICLTLEQMGIEVENSHHESGPGQHEVTFCYTNPLTAADNFISFKSAVKTVAGRNGLFASFMPKPFGDCAGSGFYLSLSAAYQGIGLFENGMTLAGRSFVAGILSHIKGICAFSNPTINSYKRFGGRSSAPTYINWGSHNRSQLIKVPANDSMKAVELHCPDPSCNPYLVFALLLEAGLLGIEECASLDGIDISERLPGSLMDAITSACEDPLSIHLLGGHLFEKYMTSKKSEWQDYNRTVHQWEIDRYFGSL